MTIKVTPEICQKCHKARTQLKKLLRTINTGDKKLDRELRKILPDIIPSIVHAYYGLEPPPEYIQ